MELSKSVIKHVREESFTGPDSSSSSSKELSLACHYISSVAPGTFDDDTDLESVDLSSNQIKELEPDVFKPLASLTKLSLNLNPIKKLSLAELPAATLVHLHLQNCELNVAEFKFSSFPNLETLDMKHAKVTRLMPDIFNGLTKLKVLNLAHCGLYMYKAMFFKDCTSLLELDISGNSVIGSNKNFFTGLSNLKTLVASQCAVGPNNHFDLRLLTSLTSLDLRQNSLKMITLEVDFHDASKIECLDVSDNSSLKTSAYLFSRFTGLTKLDLTDSSVKSLSSECLRGLDKLQELKLVYNTIESVVGDPVTSDKADDKENKTSPPTGFKPSSHKNKSTAVPKASITRDAFVQLKLLRVLDLSRGKLDFLGANLLVSLTSLEELTMNALGKKSKPVPVVLRSGTFKPFAKLKVLCLCRDEIEIVDNDCFAPLAACLERLELTKSFIKSSKDFDLLKDLKKLQTLHVQELCFDSGFLNYDHLVKSSTMKKVTMRFDQQNLIRFRAMIAAKGVPLTKHLDEFNYSDLSEYLVKNMRSLVELDLSANNLNALNHGIFDHLKQLVKLNLSKNYLTEIPAKTFDSLGQLEELNLSKNKIHSLDFNRVFKHLDKLKWLSLSDNKIVDCNIDETCNLKSLKTFYLNSMQKNDLNLIMARKMFGKKNKMAVGQDAADKAEADIDSMFEELEKQLVRLEPALDECRTKLAKHLDTLTASIEALDTGFFQQAFNRERMKMVAMTSTAMHETVKNINVLAMNYGLFVGDFGARLRQHIFDFIKPSSQLTFKARSQELGSVSHYVVFKWQNRFDNLKSIRYSEFVPSLHKYNGHYMPLNGLEVRVEITETYDTPEGVLEPVEDEEDREDGYWPNEYMSNRVEVKLRPECNHKAEPRALELRGDFRKVKNNKYRFLTHGHYLVAFYQFKQDIDRAIMYVNKKRFSRIEIADHPNGDLPLKYLRHVALIDVYDKRANLRRVAQATMGLFFSHFDIQDLNDYGILVQRDRWERPQEGPFKSCPGECQSCDDQTKVLYALYDYDLKCVQDRIRIPADLAAQNAEVIKFTDQLFYLYSKSKSSGEALIQLYNYQTQTPMKQYALYPEMGQDAVTPVIDLDNNFISISTLGRIKCYNLKTGESSSSMLVTDGRSLGQLRITQDGRLMVLLSVRTADPDNAILER